ncbi:MAG: NifB/NifX family molybdenum-iron cluster-binding protein [Proteobacteria bacterium]|nr:NifB/NifX family molybdenum-iron cluster-binding protein [Pseudomonadota bacterium]
MKIALPSDGTQVDGHFGHCRFFAILTVDENKNIVDEQRLPPPAGCGCKSDVVPQLAELGVTVMLAGNMGGGAVNMLVRHGIQVVRGCSGGVREVAEAFLAGQVADSGEGCIAHGHDCGEE